MNKITRIALIATAAAIVVGGASYAAIAATSASSTASEDSTSTPTAAPTDVSTPVTTDAPTAQTAEWPYTQVANGPERYLAGAKADGTLQGITLPSDADLMADALAACNQLAAGTTYTDVKVIVDNPHPYLNSNGQPVSQSNSANLADLASELLCTEWDVENVPTHPVLAP